jgi:hypothetical protein
LKLKLVKVWGGDQEEDEQKFFRTPSFWVVDKTDHVYIADRFSHNIKVFERDGTYLRTIGRKGRGPGDLYAPDHMSFTLEGDLVVLESGSRRIQYFSSQGKSKKIIKLKDVHWFDVTSENQLVVYGTWRTFKSRKLISLLDEQGKLLKEFGVFHDKSKTYPPIEYLHFAFDGNDNEAVANGYVPVIRKYNIDGEMTMAITYYTPFNLPAEVNLNKDGDEIEIKRPDNLPAYRDKVRRSEKGVIFERKQSSGMLETIGKCIGTDSKNRIYLLALKRERTLEEIKKLPVVIGTDSKYEVIKGELPLDREMDHLRILVFDPKGKVIAEAPVTKECDDIIVSGNRLIITDPFKNKRLLEYEIQIEEKGIENARKNPLGR